MLDERDDDIGPVLCVPDRQIVTVDAKKMPQRLERSPFVALLESVRSCNAGHQHDSQHENIFLAEAEKIPRARKRTFEQTSVSHQMTLTCRCDFKSIVLYYGFNRQPVRLIWQGRLEFSGIVP